MVFLKVHAAKSNRSTSEAFLQLDVIQHNTSRRRSFRFYSLLLHSEYGNNSHGSYLLSSPALCGAFLFTKKMTAATAHAEATPNTKHLGEPNANI
jgi:hypothetical protein